jgi:hypothetical protein
MIFMVRLASLSAFCRHDDFGGELNPGDDEKRFAIGANNQEVVALEPVIETIESVPAAFHFAA